MSKLKLTRPEIESGDVFTRLKEMHKRVELLSSTTSMDLLEVYSIRRRQPWMKWDTELGHDTLVRRLNNQHGGEVPDLRVIFAKTRAANGNYGIDAHPNTLEWLQNRFGISPVFISYILDFAFGASGRMGNALFSRRDEQGRVVGIEGFYQYSNSVRGRPGRVWFFHDLVAVSSTYFMLNCAPDAMERILAASQKKTAETIHRIGAIDALFIDSTSSYWGERLADQRGQLIQYENDRRNQMPTSQEAAVAVQHLHRLSQDFHIMMEDLTDDEERLDFLINARQKYDKAMKAKDSLYIEEQNSVEESLTYLLQRTRTWKRWVVNYNERTKIQINLFFNLASQSDNRTNLEIADLTSKIAVETQKDSSSMITIAAVTMFFLPGTFVSALFSMVFFSVAADGNGVWSFRVSPQWWYFLAVTVPLTILVFAIWGLWTRIRFRKAVQLPAFTSKMQ